MMGYRFGTLNGAGMSYVSDGLGSVKLGIYILICLSCWDTLTRVRARDGAQTIPKVLNKILYQLF